MPVRISRKRKKRLKTLYIRMVQGIAQSLYNRKGFVGPLPNHSRRARARALRGVHFIYSGPSGSIRLYIGSPRWADKIDR
jgi:hypothetical protein